MEVGLTTNNKLAIDLRIDGKVWLGACRLMHRVMQKLALDHTPVFNGDGLSQSFDADRLALPEPVSSPGGSFNYRLKPISNGPTQSGPIFCSTAESMIRYTGRRQA